MTTVENIKKYLIYPSRMNPRKTASEESIKELAASIARQGLLQPITVRPHDEMDGDVVNTTYEIVCGERRYRALSLLTTIEEVPCIVREMTDEEAMDAMITENLQRENVDPMEEAEAFRLLSERGASNADLAARFGKSEKYIRDRISLTGLNQNIVKLINKGVLPLTGGVILARLPEQDQQRFYDDNWDDDDEEWGPDSMSVQEVNDWVSNLFMRLWNAPFQKQGDLTEKWNPKEAPLYIRCDTCPNNTACQNCLFPEMAKGEPRCTNRDCYDKKTDFYYNVWTEQMRDRIVKKDEQPKPGKVVMIDTRAGYYSDSVKKRLNDWKQKVQEKGFRIFTPEDFAGRLWNPGKDDVEKGIADGTVIEAVDLGMLAMKNRPQLIYMTLKSEREQQAQQDGTARQLARKIEDITADMRKEIGKVCKEALDASDYTERKGGLDLWERNMLSAMMFMRVPYEVRRQWIDSYTPTYEEFTDFEKEHKDKDWLRQAIAAFMSEYGHQSYLTEGAKWLSDDNLAQKITDIRDKARQRQQEIEDELREMGYDENGEKM